MSCIDNHSIDTGINKSLDTLHGITCDTHTGCNTQAALAVLASHWLVLCFCDILVCDETYQLAVIVNNRQLLDLVITQNLGSSLHIGLLVCNNQFLGRSHDLADRTLHVCLEAEVTVGNNTHKFLAVINNRDTTDMVFSHNVKNILYRRIGLDCNRIIDHTVLGTLYNGNLMCLLLNGHILVDYTDTTLTSNGNSHLRLGNSIHCRSHERYVQLDIS